MKSRVAQDILFCFGGLSINFSSSMFEFYDFRTDKWFILNDYKISKPL